MRYLNLVSGVAQNVIKEGKHTKIFKDGTIAHLTDFVENGVRKSRLDIIPKGDYSTTPIRRLSTHTCQYGQRSVTHHTIGDPNYLGEAYARGRYTTVDTFTHPDGSLKMRVDGSVSPSCEELYKRSARYTITGPKQPNLPKHAQYSQNIDFHNGDMITFTHGPACRHSEVPVTDAIKNEYSFISELAQRPLHLLDDIV